VETPGAAGSGKLGAVLGTFIFAPIADSYGLGAVVALQAALSLVAALITATCIPVSGPFPSWNRSILTEIYLCHACSCHEIEDGNGPDRTTASCTGNTRALRMGKIGASPLSTNSLRWWSTTDPVKIDYQARSRLTTRREGH
jgi:hypothetical protein